MEKFSDFRSSNKLKENVFEMILVSDDISILSGTYIKQRILIEYDRIKNIINVKESETKSIIQKEI